MHSRLGQAVFFVPHETGRGLGISQCVDAYEPESRRHETLFHGLPYVAKMEPVLGLGYRAASVPLLPDIMGTASSVGRMFRPLCLAVNHTMPHIPLTPQDTLRNPTSSFLRKRERPMLNLYAGVSKKVGLPNFSSASAS